jgi:hypothetical protein
MDALVPDVTVEKLPDGTTAIRGPRGAGIVVNARIRDVVRMQFTGHLMGEMMFKALGLMDEAIGAESEFTIAIDAEHQSGYDPEVRTLATNWLLRRRDRLRPAHLFSNAPMVKMWLQMVNLSLGSKIFVLHEDRGEFESVIGKVVRDSEKMRAAKRR